MIYFETKNTTISMSVTQVTEAGNSNNMEKLEFIKTLEQIKGKKRKYVREEQKDFEHQFDVWHFCKNIRKKLSAAAAAAAAAKKESCLDLVRWNKSICNHLWWASATCGDEIVLCEKWCSILFHIQNKHTWKSSFKFDKCEHPKLRKIRKIRKTPWLKPDSDAFKALQAIILNASTLKDLKHLTQFSHSGYCY